MTEYRHLSNRTVKFGIGDCRREEKNFIICKSGASNYVVQEISTQTLSTMYRKKSGIVEKQGGPSYLSKCRRKHIIC
jgi:hypothetical protein